ncbi:hypothetical protein R3W88_016236 [Solanum pinnatisectum]|uniref:Uncharacterized protein n=1 Tax=Solanum pinnatisectum TaxID=50273 RepID=A0AAV9KY59_9SOLN|nr:hypothetical protein R3W88_016236 [Solanum pinnatisectum]
MQYTNREDGNTSSQYQQHQKQGNNNKKGYRPVQHSMDRPKSPKETLQQQQTHHTMQKIQDNNDNILGRQDLITHTSKTKKRII